MNLIKNTLFFIFALASYSGISAQMTNASTFLSGSPAPAAPYINVTYNIANLGETTITGEFSLFPLSSANITVPTPIIDSNGEPAVSTSSSPIISDFSFGSILSNNCGGSNSLNQIKLTGSLTLNSGQNCQIVLEGKQNSTAVVELASTLIYSSTTGEEKAMLSNQFVLAAYN